LRITRAKAKLATIIKNLERLKDNARMLKEHPFSLLKPIKRAAHFIILDPRLFTNLS